MIGNTSVYKFNVVEIEFLCQQRNVKISSFCYLKLCIKNKFIDQIVNNIQFDEIWYAC